MAWDSGTALAAALCVGLSVGFSSAALLLIGALGRRVGELEEQGRHWALLLEDDDDEEDDEDEEEEESGAEDDDVAGDEGHEPMEGEGGPASEDGGAATETGWAMPARE